MSKAEKETKFEAAFYKALADLLDRVDELAQTQALEEGFSSSPDFTEILTEAFGGIMGSTGIDWVDFKEATAMRTALNSETDRGCALMSVSFLDVQIEMLIRSVLVDEEKIADKLLNDSGPLGTFSSRIDLAFMLGLISKEETRELHLLRNIRNSFAHDPTKITFESEPVASRCRELRFAGYTKEAPPRRIFVRAVMGVAGIIRGVIMKTSHLAAKPEIDIEKLNEFHNKVQDILDSHINVASQK